MHGKEQVIGTTLAKALGVVPTVLPDFNTDVFGTFSGEVTRHDTALATARKKCKAALKLSGANLAVASEGSFGIHPLGFGLPANEEWLLLFDTHNNLEIYSQVVSCDTNFSTEELSTYEALERFTLLAGFPEHGIILIGQQSNKILKELTSWPQLYAGFTKLLTEGNTSVLAQTDMRAHRNPSRMRVIEQAAQELALKATTPCPVCQRPGFGLTHTVPGLPCRQCGQASRAALYQVNACLGCQHQSKKKVAEHTEDPENCDWCNP